MKTAELLEKAVRFGIVAVFGLMIVLLPSLAAAQSGAGSIQGTLKDSTGAVIPDAHIHVVNTATRVARDTKSNQAGFYEVHHQIATEAGRYPDQTKIR